MASASDDSFAHVLMAEGRIRCGNATGQHEVFQHLQRDLVFVGVAGNDTLMNDRLGPLIDDVQQMHRTIESVPSAPQRLAVQRDRDQARSRCLPWQDHRDPARQGVLQRGHVDLRQQLPQTARRGRRPPKLQRMQKVQRLFRQPLTNGIIAPAVLKHRTHHGRQSGRKHRASSRC